MRLLQPRVSPTEPADWDDDSRPVIESVERGTVQAVNIFRTLARHPKLLKRWIVFGNHVLFGSTLAARERELVILRTGYLCGAGYEWAQHVVIGRRAGLTDDEIERLGRDEVDDAWSAPDRALLAATDELVADHFVTDDTWAALQQTWNERQLMDLVFAVGQYTLVSMALNTFGVQIEPTTERFPAALFAGGRFTGRSR